MSKVKKINIFSQTNRSRVLVGELYKENGKFHFQYNPEYQKLKTAIELGPEFELWKNHFESKQLFPSLENRIPSKLNPAYKDYCKQWSISEDEDDEMILLSTIGRRGPSSFIFEKDEDFSFDADEVKKFRKELNLSMKEFEDLFELPHSTLIRLENGKSKNKILLRYLETFSKNHEALYSLLLKRGQYLHDKKFKKIMNIIQMRHRHSELDSGSI